jgi:hypothetical protein
MKSNYKRILEVFEGRDLGEIDGKVFLAMLHCRDRERHTIAISQSQLFVALLERHYYEAARPVCALLDWSSLAQNSEYPTDSFAVQSYPAVAGSL